MFHYRLEALLKLRISREDEAKLLFADQLRQHADEVAALKDLQNQLAVCYGRRNNGDDLFSTEERILFLKNAIEQQENRVAFRWKKAEQARLYFIAKKKETDILQKLKEKDHARYRKAVAKKEMKTQDDLYVMTYGREKI